jgi:hypothetical protein
VFSTLNARGLPLTAAQVLRARSLGLVTGMGRATEEATRASWDKIEGLEEEGDRFLQYYLIMRVGGRVQAKSVVREFDRGILRTMKAEPRAAERFADLAVQLDELAEVFDEVRQGAWPTSTPAASEWKKRRLRLLMRELGVKQTMPLIMSIAYRKPEEISDAVEVIERAAFVALMCFPNQTRWGDFIFEQANKFFDDKGNVESLRRDLRQFFLQQLGNPSRALSENLPINLRFAGRKKTLLRYFLTTLNDFGFSEGRDIPGKPDEQAEWNLSKIQIEHISAKALVDGISPDDKDRLGNLTPLYGPTNASVGAHTFADKLREYKESPLRMTRSLAQHDRWDRDAIDQREKAMVKFASRLFCRDLDV